MACTVKGCKSRKGVCTENNASVSYHQFPTDLALKQTWIKNVRRGDDWRPSRHTIICSLHFEDSCFREGYKRKILHSYAVPTIFPNQPLSCQPKLPKKRKAIRKYNETSSKNVEVPRKNTKITESSAFEFNEKIRRLKAKLAHYKQLSDTRGKKLKSAQRKCCRLEIKAASLENIIKNIKQFYMDQEDITILEVL